MSVVNFSTWRLTRPAIGQLELPPGYAVTAQNCDVSGGRLSPRNGLAVQTSTLAQPGALRSFYRLSSAWLAWEEMVHVVELPIDDSYNRIAFSGDGYPKQTDSGLAVQGGNPATYPAVVRRLGVQPPANPLNIETLNPSGVGDVIREVGYVFTLVTSWGEESAPSIPTPAVSVYAGETLRLSNFNFPALSGNDYAAYRLYRIEAGTTGAEYHFLTELQLSTALYDDDCLTDAAADLLESADWHLPPDGLTGLFVFADGVLCGFAGKDLCFSVPGVPYAWPEGWRLRAQEDIVGVGYFGLTVVFVSAARQYRASGTDPEYMTQDSMEYADGCVSGASVVSTEHGVYYAGPNGLLLAGPNGTAMVTEQIIDRDQWQALNPATIQGFYVENSYVGLFIGTATAIMIDPAAGDVQTLTFAGYIIKGGRIDSASGLLHLLLYNGTAYSVRAMSGAVSAPVAYAWTSAPKLLPADTCLSWCRVIGDFPAGASLQVGILFDGVVKKSKTLTSAGAFRLPIGSTGSQVGISLAGTADVDMVTLAGSTEGLQNG